MGLALNVEGVRDVTKMADKRGDSPESVLKFCKENCLGVVLEEDRQLQMIETAARSRRALCVTVRDCPRYESVSKESDGRRIRHAVVLAHIDPPAEKRYVCVLDLNWPDAPVWVEYREFVEKYLDKGGFAFAFFYSHAEI